MLEILKTVGISIIMVGYSECFYEVKNSAPINRSMVRDDDSHPGIILWFGAKIYTKKNP